MKPAAEVVKTIVLDGPLLSKNILSKVGPRISRVTEISRTISGKTELTMPKLGVISVGGERADAGSYLTQKKAFFSGMGLDLEVLVSPTEAGESRVIEQIEILNKDPSYSGIMLYLPLPTAMRNSTTSILNRIDPLKDVECMNPDLYEANMSSLQVGNETLLRESVQKMVLPCTYLACLHVLDEYGIETLGRKAAVIGNGFSVGMPIAAMLQQRGALVEQFDRSAGKLREQIQDKDIIVTGTGSKNLFDLDFVKEGCTVLDLGLTSLGEGKYRGDVPYDKLIGRARLVTPVPKGIGPITSAMLIRNLVLLWERQTLLGRTLEDIDKK